MQAIASGMPMKPSGQFNPCEYHWLMNPHNKTLMLQRFNKGEQWATADKTVMQAYFNPDLAALFNNQCNKFVLKISRDRILDESLQKIVNVKAINGIEPLKLPLTVQFDGEPGIDEGGVRKEYF